MQKLGIAFPMALVLSLLSGIAGCAVEAPAPPLVPMQFQFHSAFLMNLHHFLIDAARHAGRIDGVKWSVPPTADEMRAMHEAVTFYATSFGTRDLLFDDPLRDIKHALAGADDGRQQADGLGLPPALSAVLDRAAPVYARCLWESQDRTNRDWIAHVRVLQARHGVQIQARLERIFESRFPASIRDDVVVTTGTFTGAYTDEPPPQTVIPSGWDEYGGQASLEMIWHEAAHAGPSDKLESLIESEAHAMGREVPANLWHAALFDAVGITVSEVLTRGGCPGYVAYAERNGVYQRAWSKYVPLLHDEWRPWIAGRGSMKAAVDAMLAKQPAV